MSTTYERPLVEELRHGYAALRGNWLWFVLLGVGEIILGMVALGSMYVATLATAVAVGVLLLVSGAAEAIGAFWAHKWSGFFMHLLSGVLSVVIGLLFLRAPMDAVMTLTLLLACLLLVGGLFKVIAALTYRFAGWGWAMASGIIDLLLGLMIWQQWPESAVWVIGMYLGISLIFRGMDWIGLGLGLRTLPPASTPT